MILIVSTPNDVHARAVGSLLEAQGGAYHILDLSQYPVQSRLTMDLDSSAGCRATLAHGAGDILRFGDCRVVWWRRPQPLTIDPSVTGADGKNFALAESYSALAGLWLSLDAFWINHPTRDEEAARKVHQLAVAQQVGLRIPETRITSCVEDARSFIGRRGPGQTVFKAFTATEQAWRETRLLRSEELSGIDSVRFAPVIFQEYIPAGVDLRITAVGERFFPAAIHTQGTDYEVDFRMVMQRARCEVAEIPLAVVDKLQAFMKRLGLVYGAIDMRHSPGGEYFFLEVNPAGQWLFVEERTGQPITQALVDLMLAQDHCRMD